MPPLVRITELSRVEPVPESLHGCFLETPQADSIVEASGHQIELSGWAIGKDSPAIGIRVISNGEGERRIVLGRRRPDLAIAFPDVPEAAEAGFQALYPLAGPDQRFSLEISIVLADRRTVPMATVRGERLWRRSEQPVSRSLVSVVLAGYDEAHLLKDALDSVTAQTHPYLEVVVIDDGSRDHTAELAAGYPGVRYLRQERPGIAEARNTGIRHTVGDFLVFLEADDQLLRDGVDFGLRAFAANPGCGYVFGGWSRTAPDGTPHDLASADPGLGGYLDLLRKRSIHLGATMFRRAVFESHRFDPAISTASDWDLLLTGMREYPVHGHGRTVTVFRHGPDPAARTKSSLTDERTVLRKHRKVARELAGGREAYRAGLQRATQRRLPRRTESGTASPDPAASRAAPKVTVVTLTYNHSRFIADAIESVLRQTTTFDLELVVADDCSTDGTREIASAYRDRHPAQVRLILPEANVGAHALWREAIASARGEYVAFLDGDDYWTDPAKLEKQVRLLDGQPEHAMSFHDVSVVADDRYPDRPRLPDRRVFDLIDLLPANFIPTAAAVVRRSALDPLPAWVTWDGPGDWMTWVAAAESGSIAYIAETMAAYRVHRGGVWTGLDRIQQIDVELAVQEHLARSLPQYAAVCEAAIRQRHVQLAVERSRLPYRHPTIVVGAVPVGGWYYFNGRTIQILDTHGLVTREELEQLRHGPETIAAPDTKPAGPPQEGDVIPVVVPSDAASDIGGWEAVQAYLSHHQVLWSDDHCQIFALPVQAPGPQWRIDAVDLDEPLAASLHGRHLDLPAADRTSSHGGVVVAGWALGAQLDVDSVHIAVAGEVLHAVPVGVPRPDVAEAFPGVPGAASAGFYMWVDLSPLPADLPTEMAVNAVLTDGTTVPLGAVEISPIR